MTLLRQR